MYQRLQLISLLFSEYGSVIWSITQIGTSVHEICLVVEILLDPAWFMVLYEIIIIMSQKHCLLITTSLKNHSSYRIWKVLSIINTSIPLILRLTRYQKPVLRAWIGHHKLFLSRKEVELRLSPVFINSWHTQISLT